MKASAARSQRLSCGFLGRVRAANTRLLAMGTACLVFWAQAGAGQAPSVTINPATDVTAYSATITGTVNPNGSAITVFVGWGTALAYNSQWLETLPPQNSSVPISTTLTNLMSNTTYRCSLSAINTAGLTGFSAELSFTTLEAPTAITGPATDITVNGATIYGNLNPNGFDTAYYFQWGTTTAYGNTTPRFSVLAQNTPINDLARTLTGLSPSTTYHYQFVATNSEGTHFGGDMSFTTLSTISIQGQVFNYSTNNGTVTIWGYAGPGGAVTIPSTIAGLPVTTIADMVFLNLTNLTSVALPETVTSLGQWEFAGCTALTNVTLPNSLTNLGYASFSGCSALLSVSIPGSITDLPNGVFVGCSSLPTIIIPNSVTNIGAEALAACGSLTNLIIGNRVLSIGSGAFWQCTNLTTVTIPASTLSIGAPDSPFGTDISPFAGCPSLSAVNVDPLNGAYTSVDGVLFNKDRSKLLLCPQGKLGNYSMPDSVVVIGTSAFLNCTNLTGITISTNVAYIAIWAFEGCSGLTRITIPDSVTNIQDAPYGKGVDGGVFYDCFSLTNVVVGKGLSYLGIGAFFECTNLHSVYFKGDAPTPGTLLPGPVYVFGFDDPTTVYYLPGTTGWGATYAGQPAVLWNPQIQTGNAGFGVRPNGFGFNITGTPGIPIGIEASTNLVTGLWVLLQSCTVTNGSVYFSDPQWTNYPGRSYRIRSP